MAIYTVALAFTNALVNGARSNSIIFANDAAAKWSYYQAKSIKEQLKRLEISLTEKLVPVGQKPPSVEKETAEITRYEHEKSEIEADAKKLETQQKLFEHREHTLEYSAIGFELGIVLAGVALLQHSKVLFHVSKIAAIVAVGIMIFTYLGH